MLVTSSATRRGPRRARGASCCGASRSRRRPPRSSRGRDARGARRAPRRSARPPTAASRSSAWGTGAFRVTGARVERLIARYDLDNEEALAHIERRLRRMGVIRALEDAGFEPGDDVEIAGIVFELDPDSRRAMPATSSSSVRASSPTSPARCARDVLDRVCATVAARHAARRRRSSIVTSGAIARGMRQLDLPLRPRAIEELQAASAVGQGKLYRVYDELLRERGVPSAQVLLTFFDMSARTHYLNARQTLRKLLDWRVVPVINENDTTTTDEISFGDNDFLAAQVADPDRRRPARPADRHRRALHRRPAREPRRRAGRGGRRLRGPRPTWTSATPTSPLGSGGMRSKVVAAEMATAAGITAVIASGLTGDALEAALAGSRSGTRFPPRRRATRASSCGCSTPSPATGEVLVDAGAARALREGGTSLLPVGIVDVRGDFDAGDAVDVAERDGAELPAAIGKGISNYSAVELRRVKGMKTARCASCCRRPPRRPSTGTISCSRNLFGGWPPPPVPSPTSAARPSAPRASWRGWTPTRATRALEAIAAALEARTAEMLEANERDMEAGRAGGLDAALLDRLALDEARVRGDGGGRARDRRRCPTPSAR